MADVNPWLPGAEIIKGNEAGAMWPGSKWKLLLHTTEGGSIDGAIAAFRGANSWPHLTVDLRTGRIVQHVPFNRAARSLKSGGSAGKTNFARVIQVEIVGFSAKSPERTEAELRKLGEIVARLSKIIPFRVAAPLTFYGQDAGFTVASKTARQRLGWIAWYLFDAILGHQHAPNNDHWDPGKLDVAAVVRYALEYLGQTDTTEEFLDMDEARLKEILDERIDLALDARGLEEIPRAKRDTKGNLLLRIRDAVAASGPREIETVKGLRRLLGIKPK